LETDEIIGSHGDYYHVVEVMGFGAVCICRLMPTLRRNMLLPSSGAEVRAIKDHLALKTPGIYSIPCECGKVCIGQTRCSIQMRVKEHH
jgi:hypothetical protein